jgi:hypothetical protein
MPFGKRKPPPPPPIIGDPTNVTRGGASTSPILQINTKARSRVPNWDTAPIAQKTKAVFDSFIEVFREKGWRYAAGSFPGLRTDDILLGQQTMQQLEAQFNVAPTMDCGRIRNLLSVSFNALLPVTTADARITGHFITKKLGTTQPGIQGQLQCIGSNVYGNVRTTKTPYQMETMCIFEDHYAIRVEETNLIYDGCLTSIYSDMNAVVGALLKRSPADRSVLIPRMPPPPGGVGPTKYQQMRNEQPTGFSAGYMKL